MYLRIANPKVANDAAVTMLGVSSSRHSEDEKTIGMFGSGFKHGVCRCLLDDVLPTVFLGVQRMDYYTKPMEVDGIWFKQVCIRYSGAGVKNKSRVLDYVAEHGVKDWTHINMALREFVSNALDGARANGSVNDAVIELVEDNQVRAKDGWTQVFIPVNKDVKTYYEQIDKRFLHFNDAEWITGDNELVPKGNRNLITGNSGPCIYRKGVLVRELKTEFPSLFDYNIDSLEIDESRNCNESQLRSACTRMIADASVDRLKQLFEALKDKRSANITFWEETLDAYDMRVQSWDDKKLLEKRKANWQDAAELVLKDCVLATPLLVPLLQERDLTVVPVPSIAMLTAARDYGVVTDMTIFGNSVKKGVQLLDPTPATEAIFRWVWEGLVAIEEVHGKEYPQVKSFRKLSKDGSVLLGYREDNTVALNIDHADGVTTEVVSTALEELCHYTSGGADYTRSFQNYIFRVAVKFLALNRPYPKV